MHICTCSGCKKIIRAPGWSETESVHAIRFNHTESDLLLAGASDRRIALYDLRTSKPLKMVLKILWVCVRAWFIKIRIMTRGEKKNNRRTE